MQKPQVYLLLLPSTKWIRSAQIPKMLNSSSQSMNSIPEEWGGDTPCIPVSAKTKEGLDDLLEMVTLVAEMKELALTPTEPQRVLLSRQDLTRAEVLSQPYSFRTVHFTRAIIIAGTCVGRVRVMTNDKGERVTEAGPSVPAEITGLGRSSGWRRYL